MRNSRHAVTASALALLVCAQGGFAASPQVRDLTPRGGRAQLVVASPTDPAIVLAELVRVPRSLHRSSDGGATFSGPPTAFGGSVKLVGFDAAGRAYAAANATLWTSSDTGVSWTSRPLPWTGTSWVEVSSVTADELWAVVDDGTYSIYRSFDGGVQWISAPTPSGSSGWLTLDRFRAGSAVFAGDGPGPIFWTNDWGATWASTTPPFSTNEKIALTDGVAIADGTSTEPGLWTSADQGGNWTEVLPGVAPDRIATDPFVSGRVYCQLETGESLMSQDAGATWQEIPQSARITLVSATTLAGAPDSLRVGTFSHGVVSSEAAGPLQLAGGELPPISVRGVTIDPGDRNHIVARTGKRDLLESNDGGRRWRAASVPLVYPTQCIEFDVNGRLYVSGRVGSDPILLRRDAVGWTELPVGAAANGSSHMGDVVVSEENPELIIAVGFSLGGLVGSQIYISQDGGLSWDARALPSGRLVHSLGILEGTESPRIVMAAGTTLVGGSSLSEIFSSDDLAQTTAVHQDAVDDGFSLAHSRSVGRRVVVGSQRPGPMTVSQTGLSSSTPVGPNVPTHSLAVGSVDPDLLIRSESVAGLVTLWISRNSGASWDQLWTLPQIGFGTVPELYIRSDDSEVLVAGSPGLLSIRLDGVVGAPICGPAVIHSGSRDARVTGHRSESIAANELRLHAYRLPHNVLGFFLASRSTGFTVNPGGSFGNLCLSGSIGRDYGSVASSGALGEINRVVDANGLPTPAGTVGALAGEAWTFQLWFRDTVQGQAGSNFTDALTVTWVQ